MATRTRRTRSSNQATSYRKNFLSIGDQIDLLRSRGMSISSSDEPHAQKLLSQVGYYRLSGYWYIYRVWEDGDQKPSDQFISDVSLRKIERLYDFDRRLRNILFSAIENIEVALRASIGHAIGKQGSMAHTDPTIFRKPFSNYDSSTRLLASWGDSKHKKWLENIERKTNRSKSDFVKHFKEKYGTPLPTWVVTEVIDFSDLSKLYEGMLEQNQHEIARNLGVTDQDGEPLSEPLQSWLRTLTFVRNTCAHHSRLWNANMTDQIAPSTQFPPQLEHLARLTPQQHARVYPAIAIVAFLTENINPGAKWKEAISTLITNEQLDQSNLDRMGFPPNWHQLSLWSIGTRAQPIQP